MALRRHGLAQRRKTVGFTQESLAERLGVERSTVVRWEAGETEPLPDIRPKIAQALHISIDHLARLLCEGQQEKTGNEDRAGGTGESATLSRPFVPLNGFPVSRNKCVDPDVDMVAMQSFRAADKKVGGGHLYGTVVNYLHTQLAPRLFEVGHGTDARQVFTSAASLTELAGWMAQQLVELKELLAPHRKNTAVGDFLACCDQVLRERLCLYRGLPEDERGRSTDGVEGR